jgi:hypothetical protein
MAITDSILQARERGAPDETIFGEIRKQNPQKEQQFSEAVRRGAEPAQMLNEIIKQNPITGVRKRILSPQEKEQRLAGIKSFLQRPAPKPRFSPTEKALEIVSGAGGVATRALQTSAEALATTVEGVGEAIGGFVAPGTPAERLERVRQAGVKAGARAEQIPGKIVAGFREGALARSGFTGLGETLRPELAGEDFLAKLARFGVDIFTDPLTILSLANQSEEIIRRTEKAKPALERAGERFYQNALNPTTKSQAKEFKKLGKLFDEGIKKNVDTLGSRAAKWNFKGNFKNMLADANERILRLSQQLKNTARMMDASGVKGVNINKMLNELDSIAGDLRGVDDEAANVIAGITNSMRQKGSTLSWESAVAIKQRVDRLRQTPTGFLSESKRIAVQVQKAIGDGLRGLLNKSPLIGPLNEEITTAYAIRRAASKGAAQISKQLPGLSRRFPFIATGIETTGLKIKVGRSLINLSKRLDVNAAKLKRVFKTLGPATIRSLIEEAQR